MAGLRTRRAFEIGSGHESARIAQLHVVTGADKMPLPITDILVGDGRIVDLGQGIQADSKTEIIPAFGLVNERFPRNSPWYGLALPMTLVIDARGIVRHRFSERSYQTRPDVEVVLDVLRREAGN